MKTTIRNITLLTLALALLRPSEIRADTTVTINGLTVPISAATNFAPVVNLHYWESYLPCSIEYILSHASVVNGQPSDAADNLSAGVTVLTHPTQAQLYQYATNDPGGTNYYLSIESEARAGGPPTNTAPPYDSSVLTNIPMYFSIQVPTNKAFVDLNYYFLYAYNGPQTVRGLEPGRHFNAVLPNFAEHEGDIEGVSVRITPDFKSIIFVRYEAHGNSSYYAPSEVPFDGSHPIVTCGLYSHSSYNPNGLNQNDWIDLQDIGGLAEVVDIVDASIQWRPFDYTNLVQVGLDASNQPVNGQLWAAFAGRIGVHQLNTFQSAEGVGSGLDVDQEAFAEAAGEAAEARFEALFANSGFTEYDVDNVGVGPQGLGARASIFETQPTYSIPQLTGTLFCDAGNNLVLSVNPANPTGPLTVETFNPKLPAGQQWVRQEWDSANGTRYTYINQQTGLTMFSDGVQGDPITQTATLSSSNFWTLGGDSGNDYHAVVWDLNSDQNLNLLGNGPYNPGGEVAVWAWGGGAPNEIWRFAVPNPVQTTGRIESALTANGANFYLSANPANPTGPLVLEPFASNSAQIFIREANYSSSGVTNYTYINQLTGLIMFADGSQGGTVRQTNVISSETDWYDSAGDGNGFHAIVYGPDDNQNLNVFGSINQAGAAVGTWDWSGGAPNEIWRFLSTAPPPQRPVIIQSALTYNNANLVLSANPASASGQCVLEVYQPGDERQVWIQTTFDRVSGPSYIFVNESSGLALYSPGGDGGAVTPVTYDPNNNDLYWNYGLAPDSGFAGLQYSPDNSKNLNVLGDNSAYPGAIVATWDWSGGAANEIWQLLPDTQPPQLTLPSTIIVTTPPGQSNAIVNYTVSATDNFGIATVSSEPSSGSAFAIGTNFVYCSAVDPSSNSTTVQKFEIIVQDKEAPTVWCPDNVTVPTDLGATNAVVQFAVLSYDNSGTSTVTCVPPPGSAFPIGKTMVQCVAVDPSGNTATNTFSITVKNANPPNLGFTLSAGQAFQLTMSGVNGSQYQIQYTDDLANTNGWQVLTTTNLTGSTISVTDTNAVTQRFYRAVLMQ